MQVDDDITLTPRIAGGSRAKRTHNQRFRLQETLSVEEYKDMFKPVRAAKNTNRLLKEAQYNERRKQYMLHEALRTALYDLPFDVQEIIAMKSNISVNAFYEPCKVIHIGKI